MWFEFVLSLVLIVGGGYLLMIKIAPELASGIISSVVVFWFTKRSNDSAVNNLLRESPTLVPILNNIIPPVTEVVEPVIPVNPTPPPSASGSL